MAPNDLQNIRIEATLQALQTQRDEALALVCRLRAELAVAQAQIREAMDDAFKLEKRLSGAPPKTDEGAPEGTPNGA